MRPRRPRFTKTVRVIDWFSGIGGFRLGLNQADPRYRFVGASEIGKFQRRVYEHHFGHSPDLRLEDDARHVPRADLWCGGFPCQDLSAAGARAGFGGERSVLVLRLLEIARDLGEARPTWILLENVEGLLSVRGGGDFGVLLAALDDLGYVGAWRVLDAQYFGVAQRRRRVFVLARRADAPGPDPGAVLAVGEGGGGDPRAGRPAGEEVARTLTTGAGVRCDGEGDGLVAQALLASDGGADPGRIVAAPRLGFTPWGRGDVASTLTTATSTGGAGGRDADGLVLIPFDLAHVTSPENRSRADPGSPAPPLTRSGKGHVAYSVYADGCTAKAVGARATAVARALTSNGSWAPGAQGGTLVVAPLGARRFTPTECERLQGFPDGWTNVPDRRGKLPKDRPRIAAVGNAVAVQVVTWIGQRLAMAIDEE